MPPSSRLRLAALPLLLVVGVLLAGCKPHQKTPVIAYTVAQHAIVDLSNEEFADTLAKYFGTTRSEGRKVIDYVEGHNNRDTVAREVAAAILASLADLRNSDPVRTREEFLVQVVAPFLQCEIHDNPISVAAQQEILDRYAKSFGIGAAPNGLSAVAHSIRSYRTGGYFQVDSLNLFNRQMIPAGHLLELNNRYQQVCLLDVTDTILRPYKWKDSAFSVIGTGRGIPCYLGPEFGYSTMMTSYVVVVHDKIRQQAAEYLAQVDTSWHGTFFPDRRFAERVWAAEGRKMKRADADRILVALLRRDFQGRDLAGIEERLETETAIHEAKHKTDDIDLPAMKLNLDCEVSAHLTQAICGPAPFHGLVEAIQRMEGFYVGTGEPSIAALLFQLWDIAERASRPGYSPDTLRADLMTAYSTFMTESTKTPLPPLDEFRAKLVPLIEAGTRQAAARER